MKICILTGSPQKNGNTAALLEPFIDELESGGASVDRLDLHGLDVRPCLGCRICQDVPDGFGCVYDDDMQQVFDTVLPADCVVLATPIYSWYCTAPMKAALDRLVYGMNKYYGSLPEKISLWRGKRLAVVTTCGYKPETGADLFEQGMIRYCKHSTLQYAGMLAVRNEGYGRAFMDAERVEVARAFARKVLENGR